MKNKLLIYILLSFFCMVPAKAQVLEYYVQADDHAIVREFDTAEALAYVEDVSGQGYFMFYSYGSSFALKFQCLNGWSVKDVRIRDGKAYFCGTVAGHVALVGCFDVLAVFAGTDSVNYTLMDWMSPDSLVLATSLNRLDLMPVGPRAVMAMVGDAWYQQYAYKTTAVVSAYFTGSQWFIYQFVNKDAYVRYTDIAYLDNMIVAVGPDSTGKNCLMKSFHPYIDFPNNPFVFRAVSRLSYTSLVGKVLAGYVGANTMEVAQHVFPKYTQV